MELKGDKTKTKNQHLKYRQAAPVGLAKEHPDLPDFFTLQIELRNGEIREMQAIDAFFVQVSNCYEIILATGGLKVYPLDVIAELTYDNDYILIKQIKKEIMEKRAIEAQVQAIKGQKNDPKK